MAEGINGNGAWQLRGIEENDRTEGRNIGVWPTIDPSDWAIGHPRCGLAGKVNGEWASG